MPRIAALATAVFFAATPGPAADRTLYWSGLDVEARLDGGGRLHVKEKQTIVFDGDWNGAERTFNVQSGQTLRLDGIDEIDSETGESTSFSEGSLENTQTYAWHTPAVLRWRARATTDPAFANTTKIYTLRYTLSPVVQKRGDRFRLNHDFAFRDRRGVIERFTLDLKFDPEWEPGPHEMPVVRTGLQPGSSYVLAIPLRYTGSGTPAVRDLGGQTPSGTAPPSRMERLLAPTTPAPVQTALAVILAIGVAAHLVAFYRGETKRGRFEPLDDVEAIDARWLEKHVFSRKAEVIGAAWDEQIGPTEVAAMLARLAVEGYISTRVEHKSGIFFERDVLHLTKLRDFDELPAHERWLLQAFFGAHDETNTDIVRKRYARHGFNPVSGIEDDIRRALPWPVERGDRAGARRDWTLLAIGFVLIVIGVVATIAARQFDDTAALLGTGLGIAIILPFLVRMARSSGRNAHWPHLGILRWLVPLTLALMVFHRGLFSLPELHPVTLIVIGAFALLAARIIIRFASTTGGEERISVRRKLIAAREFFVRQLRREDPQLDDRWFPYLIAFGLDAQVAKWFRAFGGAANASSRSDFTSSSSSSFSRGSGSGTSISSWTGGGGAFGGAGASGSWGAAASGIAAGVAAPSSGGSSGGGSSGSSSSSSSGSSSSGGGGGGGW